MDNDIFAQMMEGLKGAGKTMQGAGKKKLKFDSPAEDKTTIELPETEIPPDEPVGPPAPEHSQIEFPVVEIAGDPLANAPHMRYQGPGGPGGDIRLPAQRNVIDLQPAYDEQVALASQPPVPSAVSQMPLPEPMPASAALPQHTEAGLQKKPSSTQKAGAPRPAAEEQHAVVESGTTKEVERTSGPDSRLSALDDRQKGFDRERMKSLEEAASARNMSTEEMVAMALVTLLPTLVGGIAGGALAGKGGATAGIAGGLQGGAQGFSNLIAQKQKDKEAAMAEAARLGQRSDQLEGEKGQRLGQLEAIAEHDKTRAANKDIALIKEEGDTKRSQASNAAHIRAANISAYSHLKAAQIAANRALAAAEQRAKQAEEGGALKDYQGKSSTFATGMLTAEHVLSQVKQPTLLNSFRTWGAIKNALASDKPQEQMYARAVYGYLDAVARDESGSAINEGEWDQYFNTYFPRNTSSAKDIEYARKMRMTRLKSMLGKAGPAGARIAIESYQSEFGAPAQQQPGGQPPAAQAPSDKPLTSKWGAGR